MQKIMFNERFGLQQATFDGIKTMTRRAVPEKTLEKWYDIEEDYRMAEPAGIPCYLEPMEDFLIRHAPYKVGEIVAIAQRYKDAPNLISKAVHYYGEECKAGWNNKMFVKAEYMPHHIKITSNKVEPLCGISDEDCLREGIIDTGSGYTCYKQGVLPLFRTPYAAFKALIDKLNHRGFFETNPLVFAYSYEIID